MLCGASDTVQVSAAFETTVRNLGGEALWYQAGTISYLNGPDSNWAANSRRTVSSADLCVFVIIEHYGEITWSTELDEALTAGVPFIILCLRTTYNEYNILRRNGLVDSIPLESKKNLVTVMMQIESERQLTVVPFDMTNFHSTLVQQTSMLLKLSLQQLSERNKRIALYSTLRTAKMLSPLELDLAEKIATDEFEDRNKRILALKAIANRGTASESMITSVVASNDRDVQRAAFDFLPQLCSTNLIGQGFFEDCVTIANTVDDVGIGRRLIPALFKIDPSAAVETLTHLDLSEIGCRRRLAAALEDTRATVFEDTSTRQFAIDLLRRCTGNSPQEEGWLGRARRLLEQYQ